VEAAAEQAKRNVRGVDSRILESGGDLIMPPEGSTPILATKLYIPPPRPKVVHRSRLIERLNEGLQRKLTLISAPAGFGKTTIISEWLDKLRLVANNETQDENKVAWLSLDEGDNDPVRFLSYFIAALNQIEGIGAAFGKGAMAMLQSTQSSLIEAILTPLINEIAAIPDRIILVLDDYHLIDAQPIHDALAFLLEHLPPQMHLVIATREDPHLPLARLRVRGQLTELRATDLRFTPSEAAGFLNQVIGLNLSAEDIAALETRTEGWIAGLQLAAISMQGQKDTTSFIKSFTGSHYFVMDYLVEEVLQQQFESVQTFLLRTSILDRMCGPLCDALLLDPLASGQKTLEYLEHANLFIVPLDNERRWYRYHHLFADLLRQRLHQSTASSTGDEGRGVAELHIRASVWYEENGLDIEAIHHAIAAGDYDRTANLIELAWPGMDGNFQSATWLNWVRALPENIIKGRPVLCADYAQALMDVGELDGCESLLQDAERWLKPGEGQSKEMVVADREQFHYLAISIANSRAYRAQVLGDIKGSIKYAKMALGFLTDEDPLRQAQGTSLLASAYWAGGDLEAAQRALTVGRDGMEKAGNILFAIACTVALVDIVVDRGLLHQAGIIIEKAFQIAKKQSENELWVTANLFLVLSMINLEHGNIEVAEADLIKGKQLSEKVSLGYWPYRSSLAEAGIKETEGDLEGALGLINQAELQYFRNPTPNVRPVSAIKARLWIRLGRLREALDWAGELGLSVDDELSFLREYEHITLVRVLIAQYKNDDAESSLSDALKLLKRLFKAAEDGNRLGSFIEILVLQALAYQAHGNIPLALPPLKRALAIAEPEGYVRIFIDEGPAMAGLLSEAAAHGNKTDYIVKLLSVFGDEQQKSEDKSNLHPAQHLIEPLSQRELEVLVLIAQGLSNHEISERLFLALSTVKGHNLKIFGKLEVQRRTEAVARARELGLL
jgi:LuxR family maltose regulon positive regulatory protein